MIDILEWARGQVGLDLNELWLRYFALGGMSTALEVEAYLYGALEATTHDRDLLALAINERFLELGAGQPIAYSDDLNEDEHR